jgi:hypothetical protein
MQFGGNGRKMANTHPSVHTERNCSVPTALLMQWRSGRPRLKASTGSLLGY